MCSANYVKKIVTLHRIFYGRMREKLIFTWSLPLANLTGSVSTCILFLLMCGNSRLYQRLRTLCTVCDIEKNTSESTFKMICGPRRLFSFVTLCEEAVPAPQIYSYSLRKKDSEDRAVNHCFGIKCKKNWLFMKSDGIEPHAESCFGYWTGFRLWSVSRSLSNEKCSLKCSYTWPISGY